MFSSKQSNQSNSQTEKDSNNVTAHLSKVKGRQHIQENFDQKTRITRSQQLKSGKSKQKNKEKKAQTPENQGQSEEKHFREENIGHPENKKKNEEKSEEKQPQVQEEKRDRAENKEQKNEEKEMKKQVEQARCNIDERQNAQSNGQEAIEPKRNSTINGKKRKHAMLFDVNDPKNDLCSSAKKNLQTPSEAAVKFVQDGSALPFTCASQRFYLRQNKKAIKNAKRTKRRQELPVLCEDTELIGLQRSTVEGSLEQNIERIKKEVNSCTNKTRYAELWAVVDVAMELQKSILLETSTAASIYKKRKASLLNKKESLYFRLIDTYEKLSKHINIAQIYIDQKSFIVEAKDTDIRKVVEIVSDTLKNLSKDVVRERVHSCLKENFRYVLWYLDSKRDRDVLEAVIAKITSVKSVVSIKSTKFKGSVSKHRAMLDSTLKSFKEINQSCQTVRNNMTVSQQHS